MKKIFILSSLSLAIGLGFNSCQKEETFDPKENAQVMNSLAGVSFNGHWLVFDNDQSFQTVLSNLSQMGVNNFESNFPGYTSLRQKNDSLSNEDYYPSYDFENAVINGTVLYSDFTEFATLITPNGKIQVGDSIYCFTTGTNSYAVHKSHTRAIIANTNPASIAGAKAYQTSFNKIFRSKPYPGIKTLDPSPYLPSIPPSGPSIPTTSFEICDFEPWKSDTWGDFVAYVTTDKFGATLPTDGGKAVRVKYKMFKECYIFAGATGSRVYLEKNTSGSKWKTKNALKFTNVSLNVCSRGSHFRFDDTPYENNWENSVYTGIFSNRNDLKATVKSISSGFGYLELRMNNNNTELKARYAGKEIEHYFLW